MLYNNWFVLHLCVCRDIEHLGSLESTKEARVASFVLSELPAYLIVSLRNRTAKRLCVTNVLLLMCFMVIFT